MRDDTKTRELWWTAFDADALIKGATTDDGGMGLIEGFASTEHRDKDDEIIRQAGLDWVAVPRLTLEHPSSVTNQLGEVLSHEIVTHKGELATKVQGGLYLGDSDAYSAKIYKAARQIAKSGGRAQFGFSVEGDVLERDPADRRIITKARVSSVAITMGPRNEMAQWAPIMKGLLASAGIHATLARGLSVTDLQIAHIMRRRPDLALTRAEGVALLRSTP